MEEVAILLVLVLAFALIAVPVWMLVLLYELKERLNRLERASRTAAPAAAPAPQPASVCVDQTLQTSLQQASPPREETVTAGPAMNRSASLGEKGGVPPAQPASPPLPAPPPAMLASPLPNRPPPLPPAAATAFERAAEERLHAAWSWFVAGDAGRRKDMSFEAAVAVNWLTRLGVLVLVVGVGFFIKYSIDKGLLGPEGRVALSCLAGAALLAAGVAQFGRKYHVLGQGLAGAGLAVLYFAVYAAAGLFGLVTLPVGFVLMAAVTLTAGVLAVRHRALLLAVLGALGGYLTPVMLAGDAPEMLWLYGYLLALLAGVAGVVWRSGWSGLTWLSFACHNGVFLMACSGKLDSTDPLLTVPFLAASFVGYSLSAAFNGLRGRRAATAIELIGLTLAAAVFISCGYGVVEAAYGRAAVAWLTLGMAAFYVFLLTLLLRRNDYDRALAAALLGLGGAALALTLPLVFSEGVLTVAWSVLAVAAWWVAGKVGSRFLRVLSGLLLVFVVGKLLTVDLSRLCFSYRMVGRPYAEALPGRALNVLVPVVALAVSFVYLSFEAVIACKHLLPGFTAGAVSVLWGVLAFAYVWVGIRFALRPLRAIGLGVFCVTVAKVFLYDLADLESVYRIAAFVGLGAVLLLAAYLYLKQPGAAALAGREKKG